MSVEAMGELLARDDPPPCWDDVYTYWRCCGDADLERGICWPSPGGIKSDLSKMSCCAFRPHDSNAIVLEKYHALRSRVLWFLLPGAPVRIEQDSDSESLLAFLDTHRTVQDYVAERQDVLVHSSAWYAAQWLASDPPFRARRAASPGRDVIELCAGVGVLSVAILRLFAAVSPGDSPFRVLATDLSERSLDLIRRNARGNLAPEVAERLGVMPLDVLRPAPPELVARVAQHGGFDIVSANAIDWDFKKADGVQGFASSQLPLLRELLGTEGRAWVLAIGRPGDQGTWPALARALQENGLELVEWVDPRARGFLSEAQVREPALLVLRAARGPAPAPGPPAPPAPPAPPPALRLSELRPGGDGAVRAAEAVRRHGYVALSGLGPLLGQALRFATARSNASLAWCAACEAVSMDVFDGAFDVDSRPIDLFSPPGWAPAAAKTIIPRLHREMKRVAVLALEALAAGHAALDPGAAAWLSDALIAADHFKTAGATSLLRLFVYAGPGAAAGAAAGAAGAAAEAGGGDGADGSALRPPPGEKFVGTGPHQDVSWLTLIVQDGARPLWLKPERAGAWARAGAAGAGGGAELVLWPGARLHAASRGFFPLSCHAVGAGVAAGEVAATGARAGAGGGGGSGAQRVSWVMLAPNNHCVIDHLPNFHDCRFKWKEGLPTGRPEGCVDVREKFLGRLTGYPQGRSAPGSLQQVY